MNKHFLDLRKKGIDNVKIIERIIFKPRSFKYEVIKILSVVAIATAISFGVSNADNIPFVQDLINPTPETEKEINQLLSLNTRGIISAKDTNSFTISDTGDNSGERHFPYTVLLDQFNKTTTFITDTKEEISFDDIEIGHTVVARTSYYEEDLKTLFAYKVILLTSRGKIEIETATTTLDILSASTTATTTDIELASTTDDTTNSTTTDETVESSATTSITIEEQTVTEKIIATFVQVVDGVAKTFQVILNTLTGETSTTTVETIIEENATTSDSVIKEDTGTPEEESELSEDIESATESTTEPETEPAQSESEDVETEPEPAPEPEITDNNE